MKKNIDQGVKNADRHFVRWKNPDAKPLEAALTFRLIVPASELREISGENRLTKVHWLPAPESQEAIAVECYFTPPISGEPNPAQLPYTPLVMWQLSDFRWFVALFHSEVVTADNASTLSETRSQMARVAKECNVALLPKHRAVVFFENAKGYRGMIEMVPFDDSENSARHGH